MVVFALLLGICGTASTNAPPPLRADSTMSSAGTSEPRRIVYQNRYYAKPGKEEETYRWRVHASDVLEQLGVPRGQVFRGAGGDQPDVIWQLELDPAAAERANKRAGEVKKQFDPVMEHMATLVRFFESSRYEEVSHREARTETSPK
jgi:hypothetical protein